MDIIVGCNGVDLTELTFNECMAVIRQADWPKTLHFIRDTAGPDLKPCIKEGWAKFGVLGGAHRKRYVPVGPSRTPPSNPHRPSPDLNPQNPRTFRYIELREGELSYTKPTPGGAIAAKPDGSVDLTAISTMTRVEDRTADPQVWSREEVHRSQTTDSITYMIKFNFHDFSVSSLFVTPPTNSPGEVPASVRVR